MLGSPLVVPGAESLLGPEQPVLVEKAKESSPEAVKAREESRTKFANLNTEQAEKTDAEAFPEVVDHPVGGPPPLPEGQKITGFPSDNVAQVELGGGERGVIEASEPMAVETSAGHRAPVDLSLSEVGSGFAPATPAVGIQIPKRLSAGVQIPALSLSLTPVNAQSSALAGSEGSVVGTGVLYANTQTDTDTLVKPTTAGFEADTLLRSVESPEVLYFRVGLPEGASLVQAQAGAGPVRVVKEGQTIALVRPPSATDAAGTSVPVSMSVTGDMVTLTVTSHNGEYQWPIEVDPEIEDTTLGPDYSDQGTSWLLNPNEGNKKCPEAIICVEYSPAAISDWTSGSLAQGQHMDLQYETQGVSKIYEIETGDVSEVPSGRSMLEFAGGSGVENELLLAQNSSYVKNEKSSLCAKKGENPPCATSSGSSKNLVRFEQTGTSTKAEPAYGEIYKTGVYIFQEQSPATTFNTTEAKIKVKEPNGQIVERENVLYPGSTGWIGPYSSTAFEMIDKDPGVGVSFVFLGDGSWGGQARLLEEGKCEGVQCSEEYKAQITYDTILHWLDEHARLPDGETSVRDYAEDAAGLYGESDRAVRVDATPPHSIKLSGLPEGGQLGEGVYKVKAQATDGEGATPSSGVASLKLGIDGAEAGEPRGSCPRGPCTAGAEWTINAGQLGAGAHMLTVLATDNAGNMSDQSFPIFVHHATPTAVGPGSLDPESGNFSLGASDVSIGSGLSVSRTYSSRNLTAGVEGPFGPQWSMSLAGSESLGEAPDGSIVLTGSDGAQTAFKLNSKGEFESPKSDANLTLSVEEGSQKLPIAYYLKDLKAGTSTKFARPANYLQSTPSYYGQVGWEGVGNGQFNTPAGVAVDAKGDVWVTDVKNNRVEEFNPQGEYVRQFGWEGTVAGDLKEPYGIAVDAKGDVWVADTGNNRIEEFSETGEYERQASVGSSGIALKAPHGIAVDGKGNIWVADTGNNRVQEFNEKAEPVRQAGPGAGSKELSEPLGVATNANNDVWVTDAKNHRFVEFSETGGYLNAFGSQGTGNGQFETPVGVGVDTAGDVWVGDYAENRIQEFKSNGEYLTQIGTTGSGGGQFKKPYFLAVDARGMLSIADSENDRVQRWGHTKWLPSTSEGPVATDRVTYTYQTVLVNGKTVIEPTEAVAPHAAELSCAPKLERGCRALTFGYASATTATGEGSSEWGEYKGDLTRIYFHGWEPVSKEMKSVEIAHYAYDTKGRLRAEWDPQITPTQQATYGYDAEGHVTAVSPPQQQPWLLTYGTIPTDGSPGRLISATRPAASTAFGNGLAPQNTALPSLSSSAPVMGAKLTVSGNGSWSNGPLTYGYQWEDCNLSGGECTAILGATNFNYTPTAQDVGHTLRAVVSASDGGGSATATTSATAAVGGSTQPPTYSGSFGSFGSGGGQFREPVGLAVDSSGDVWVADWANSRFQEFNGEGKFVRSVGVHGSEPGQVEGIDGIAVDSKGNVWISEDGGNNRVEEFTSEGVYVKSYGSSGSGEAQFNTPGGLAVDSKGDLFVADRGNHRVEELNSEGKYVRSFSRSSEKEGPFDVQLDSKGDLWVSYAWDGKIAEFSPEGSLIREWGTKGTAEGDLEDAYRLQIGPEGNIWVAEWGNNRVQVFTTSGAFLYKFGTNGTGEGQFVHARGIGFYDANVYVVDSGTFEGPNNNRIEKWVMPATLPTPPNPGTSAVTTIEYKVPLSGTGLQNMSAAEVGKWGQTDDPAEATAIFPPDEPQGWPASSYTSARVSYYDGEGRLVNVASPSGGVATTEYNEANEVVRTLAADNRAAALKEGSKSAEVAKKLDNESTYNEEDSELMETLGPEHKVKLSSGGEAQARHRVKYAYNQGVPLGETYNLVTETVDSALVGGKEEEKRTTATSYSGQGGLGWQLRKPTSVTVDPTGLKLTTTTVYNRTTGDVTETMTPAGKHEPTETQPPTYSGSFGSFGSGGGQFREPVGLAVDSSGDVWVADWANSRFQEFNGEGKFVRSVGVHGSEPGQVEGIDGIAVDSKGNVWISEDGGNNRVEEFTSEGVYVKSYGSSGSGEAQFNTPGGLAVDSKGDLFVADRGNHRVEELNSEGKYVRSFSRSSEKEGPFDVQLDSKGDLWVSYAWDGKIAEFSPEGSLIREWGTKGTAEGDLEDAYRLQIGPEGNIWVAEWGNNRVQVFTTSGAFLYKFGTNGTGEGQFVHARGIGFYDANVYVVDSGTFEGPNNNRVEKWVMPVPSSHDAHNKQTTYYTGEANTSYPECGGHAEWEGMPCQTRPSAQPETAGLPSLPVTTVTYNMWGEPETTTEKFPATGKFPETERKEKLTYNGSGQPKTSEETSTSSSDKALPMVTNTESFGEVCGQTKIVRCVTQSTTEGETTKTITSIYDTLGRLVKYTDADANTTSYEYEESGDGRLTGVSEPKGSQTYAYAPTTGLLTKLVDSAAGTFTAGYDVEGNMESETYPNGMTASYTRNQAGETTSISYVKSTHCAGTCPETWFSETNVPSIHGETLSRSNTLTSDSYVHDAAGRLTETAEEPAGEGCTMRIYAYEEDSNRTSLTTRKPGSEGKCAGEGGSVEAHTYDAADRLDDAGVEYDPLGDTIKLPASDAGSHELTSSYYVDGQVEKQSQNGQENTYYIDPAGRIRETVGKGSTNATVTNHYAGPGEALSWKNEGESSYTRLIPGIDGSLSAIQTNSGAPALQLHDLQGDIVGTVGDSESETKLLTKYNSTEFGVPTTGSPPRYSWLGATGASSELSSGTLIEGTVAYQPQLGRALQTQAIAPPGEAINGAEGQSYHAQLSAWSIASANEAAARHVEEGTAEEKRKAQEAQEAILRQCQEEGGCGAEEGGDPCKTAFTQGSVSFPVVGEVAGAWATISWCYNGHRVLSASEKNHGDHVYNHWYSPVETEFVQWEDSAEWLSEDGVNVYVIKRVAVFSVVVEDGVPSEFEGGVAPQATWSIDLEFELFPDGESHVFTSYSCSPAITCP